MFYFNSNNLCNGGEMVKKIGLSINLQSCG